MPMLCTRRPTLAALGSLAAPVKAPNKQQQSTMAKATRTIWVKGDPQQQVLGDCPFCHRALLTLEMKVRCANKLVLLGACVHHVAHQRFAVHVRGVVLCNFATESGANLMCLLLICLKIWMFTHLVQAGALDPYEKCLCLQSAGNTRHASKRAALSKQQ